MLALVRPFVQRCTAPTAAPRAMSLLHASSGVAFAYVHKPLPVHRACVADGGARLRAATSRGVRGVACGDAPLVVHGGSVVARPRGAAPALGAWARRARGVARAAAEGNGEDQSKVRPACSLLRHLRAVVT